MPWLRAATDNPFGALPYDQVLGIQGYYTDTAAGAIYPGDVVIQETDGGITVSAASSNVQVGVAAQYQAASTENNNFLVYDNPKQRYTMQDDSDTTGMTRASIGLNADLVVTTGDTTTLRSLHEIDSSSVATTAGLAVKVLKLHPIETNSYATTTGQWRKWVIILNSQLYGGFEVAGV